MTPRRDELGQHVGGVAHERDRPGDAVPRGIFDARERLVEVVGALVEVARRQAALDARRIDLDDERDAVVHGDGERLGAAHAAEAGGDDEAAGQACRRSAGAPSAASVS